MTDSPSVSEPISIILEVLAAIRTLKPKTLAEAESARGNIFNSIAASRHITVPDVYDTVRKQLHLDSKLEYDARMEFNTLVLNWLTTRDPDLQSRFESESDPLLSEADVQAIRQFFREYWWVNQGMTFEEERNGGYLWAPQLSKTGRPLQHHVNVSLVQPGDIIFHYSQSALRAIGQATTPAQKAPRPVELPSAPWDREGYTVAVEYAAIPGPIRLDRIPLDWRLEERGPFNRDGDVNQGYLYPLSADFVGKMLAKFNELWLFPMNNTVLFRTIWYGRVMPDVLEHTLRSALVGSRNELNVTGFRDAMRPDDIVVLWQTGNHPGIHAIGKFVDEPKERVDGNSGSADSYWYIIFQFTHIFPRPISPDAMQADPLLRNTEIIPKPETRYIRLAPSEWVEILSRLVQLSESVAPDPDPPVPTLASYIEPAWPAILAAVKSTGLIIEERMLRRYHLSLKTRGFVILSGLSGIGKTWLAQVYADAVRAEAKLVAVAPNWTTNEDLLGYFNPLDLKYHDTAFSRFLRDVSAEYTQAKAQGYRPRPYHLILDEMNLARVEYYFAHFLSAIEVRARDGLAPVALGPETVMLPPNLFFIGTVNIDETTHGFADKIYDRAQLIEIHASPTTLHAHFQHQPYSDALIEIWNAVHAVAPFGFRVLDEIAGYVDAAEELDVAWEQAFDEQVLQKILPKLKGADLRIGHALEECIKVTVGRFSLSHAKAQKMKEDFDRHGSTSYF